MGARSHLLDCTGYVHRSCQTTQRSKCCLMMEECALVLQEMQILNAILTPGNWESVHVTRKREKALMRAHRLMSRLRSFHV